MSDIIEKTILFVKETLADAEKGHDWFHIQRVRRNALLIAKENPCNLLVVELGALLHDIADSKFHGGDHELGPKIISEFLQSLQVEQEVIDHVANIARHISFSANIGGQQFMTPELAIVQDADRLDALGAIGIARAFTYGGKKDRVLYDPDIPPAMNLTKEEYAHHKGPTLNHFYEKLFLLVDLMNTSQGKALAKERTAFMKEFVDQFKKEF